MIYRTFQLGGRAQFTIQIRSLDGVSVVPEAKTFENFAGSTDRPGGRSMLAMG